MEQLLHYTWKHKLFPLGQLHTTDGQPVEVLDVGQHNYDQGPDFFNAKIKIDGQLWVGNVEIHQKSSEWYQHGHETDAAYNNVILHIVDKADREVQTENGLYVPQMELKVPQHVAEKAHELLTTEKYPPCYKIIPSLTKLKLHSWLTALQTERLEQKMQAIEERLRQSCGSWEAACFITLARNYGFGVNGDAFEHWAKTLPLQQIARHRDDLFQISAIFLGQAGLFPRIKDETERQRLEQEYAYMRHKFQLEPIDPKLWKYMRMRPHNFPHVRILQLAQVYHERRTDISRLLECQTLKDVHELLSLRPSVAATLSPTSRDCSAIPGVSATVARSSAAGSSLSPASLNILTINTIVPLLFAYGKAMGKPELQDRAFDLLETIPAEDNIITRTWHDCGLDVSTAGDSQALIQLKREYCDRRKCLYCRIGYEFLKIK